MTSGVCPSPYSPTADWSQMSKPVAITMAPNVSVTISSCLVEVRWRRWWQNFSHSRHLPLDDSSVQWSRSMTGTLGTACGNGT